jgi:hypothetical protein
MLQGVGEVTACDLNPLIWSGNQPTKMPAANLHGTVPSSSPNQTTPDDLYRVIVQRFQAAVQAFESLYSQQSAAIDTILFSADGDFIHDFFDCMYLGPYTRVDLLACDTDGNTLDCPYYARDKAGGASREFTACFGEEMQGDHNLPFTCGSQARRSLIKYFFRNYSQHTAQGGQKLNLNVSQKIKELTERLIQNYSHPNSWGCWDPVAQKCQLSACRWENGYAPCLDSNYEISSQEVSDFVVHIVLGTLPDYYALSMHDSLPWTAYAPPTSWHTASAAVAQQLGLFAPHKPIVTYGPEEAYKPVAPTATLEERTRGGSMWGLCTSLLSQTAMSLPLLFSKEQQQWFPAGFWQALNGQKHSDMNDLEQVEWVVGNITQLAMEHSPFVWHQAKRHAPSQSAVCARIKQQWGTGKGKLNIGSVNIQTRSVGVTARVQDGLSFPFFGFLRGHLGYANQTCVCAENDPTLKGQCVMSSETCASFVAVAGNGVPNCEVVMRACSQGGYDRANVPLVWECLRQVGPGVRCPELGPSDWWGLFPVDCTASECDMAQQWLTEGANSIPYDATRFLNEGRAGVRLPNYKHVNATYPQTIHYGQSQKNTMNLQQPQCFAAADLFPTADDEDVSDDNIVRKLFPAVQALFDSPSTATCTRFVLGSCAPRPWRWYRTARAPQRGSRRRGGAASARPRSASCPCARCTACFTTCRLRATGPRSWIAGASPWAWTSKTAACT